MSISGYGSVVSMKLCKDSCESCKCARQTSPFYNTDIVVESLPATHIYITQSKPAVRIDTSYRDRMKHALVLRMGIKGSNLLTLWTTSQQLQSR